MITPLSQIKVPKGKEKLGVWHEGSSKLSLP